MNVQEIYELATARRDLVKSCRVTYTVTTRQFAKLPADEAMGAEVLLEPYRIDFCFEGERRKLLREPIVPVAAKKNLESYQGQQSPLLELTVFDGKMSLNYSETSIAELSKGKHPRADHGEQFCHAALGIPITDGQRATYDNAWYYPHCLREFAGKKPDYFVHAERADVDVASTIVVEATGYDKLWIDPALHYACRRRERWYSPEQPHLIYRDTLRDFVEAQPGLFVARWLLREVFPPLNNPREYWDKPYLEMRFDVTRLAVNDVTDADFRVELPSGTLVTDYSDHKVYQVPGEGFDALGDLAEKGQAYHLEPADTDTGQK